MLPAPTRTDDPVALQVNVFVNGALILFSMKISDAGKAFFVFETDVVADERPRAFVGGASPSLDSVPQHGRHELQHSRAGLRGCKVCEVARCPLTRKHDEVQ